MNTSSRDRRNLTIALMVALLLVLVSTGCCTAGAKPGVLNIGIAGDGSAVFTDSTGEPIPIEKAPPVTLETPVEGSFVFFKSVSLFTVKGSPVKVYVDYGDTVYCLVIDDQTGKFIRFCRR